MVNAVEGTFKVDKYGKKCVIFIFRCRNFYECINDEDIVDTASFSSESILILRNYIVLFCPIRQSSVDNVGE